MTFEDYINFEYAQGKIDFTFRAHVWDGKTTIYVHPSGKDGKTTPTLTIKGDVVEWPKVS